MVTAQENSIVKESILCTVMSVMDLSMVLGLYVGLCTVALYHTTIW